MSNPVNRFEFAIKVEVVGTRRQANKIREAMYDQIEIWQIDHGHNMKFEGLSVIAEPLKAVQAPAR